MIGDLLDWWFDRRQQQRRLKRRVAFTVALPDSPTLDHLNAALMDAHAAGVPGDATVDRWGYLDPELTFRWLEDV